MTRTNVTAVRRIADFDGLSDQELTEFMEDANTIIDNRLKGHTTDAQLKMIEKWLTCHLASMMEQRVSEEKVGSTEFVYEGSTGMGLQSTRYGQTAVELDPTGRLEADGKFSYTVWDDD